MTPTTVRWFWGIVSMQILMMALVVARMEGAQRPAGTAPNRAVADNAQRLLDEGRRVFRFETFGDEAFWGDSLRSLQRYVEEQS